MPPLFMETGSESSVSSEEHQSNTAGSGRGGGARKPGDKRGKRKEKNRDAARKSRKKQTERADELHEELQGLERSNTALEKEIAALKRDHLLYATALERHKPLCLLRSSGSSPPTHLPASPSPAAAHQTCSNPSPVPLRNSYTGFPAPSLSTFLTSNPGLSTLNCTHQSPSTPVPTTNASNPSSCSSADLFASSGPSTRPSVSSSTVPSPHSLFGEGPPPLTSSQPTPVYTSLIAPLSQTNSAILPSCSHAVPPGHHSDLVDTWLMNQGPVPTSSLPDASSPPALPEAENASIVAQGCPLNAPQLHSVPFSGTLNLSSPPCTLLPSSHQGPILQPTSVYPQMNLDLSSAPAFALKSSFSQNTADSSLLALLTVPSPLDDPQTTSSNLYGPVPGAGPGPGLSPQQLPLCQQPPSLPPLADPSRDLSLFEFLECNDWILGSAAGRWDL
ncbi:transcription factor kayak [Centroberyx affinis]|uniref:transcription factor kayak n=1 Tax=Centroberyx affinis TaxID=166261 RepID=UPI003A5C283A